MHYDIYLSKNTYYFKGFVLLILDFGMRNADLKLYALYSMLRIRNLWMLETGCWILDARCWMLANGTYYVDIHTINI